MMDVIVVAGGIPERGDPLYAFTQGGYKTMLDVSGKPMVQWVLDALSDAASVQRVAVVGLPPITALDCKKPLIMLSESGEIVENIRLGALELAKQNPEAAKVLILSADLPAITPEMIEWLIQRVEESDHELFGFLLNRATIEAVDKDSRRVFMHLKNTEVCLADVAGLQIAFANRPEHPLWQRLVEARKSPTRQAALLGYDVLFLLMLRQLTLKEAESSINRRLGINARAVSCPFPELGLDVDRPRDIEVLCDFLTARMLSVEGKLFVSAIDGL